MAPIGSINSPFWKLREVLAIATATAVSSVTPNF
jgi:hypothetical protein